MPHVAITYKGRPMVVKLEGSRFGISDSVLMGTLAVMGYDPISDTPRTLNNERLYWVFDNDDAYKIAVAFYGNWNGNTSHVAFVRLCLETRNKFKDYAISRKQHLHEVVPSLTLRRL